MSATGDGTATDALVPTIRIPRTDLEISRLALGVALLGTSWDDRDAFRAGTRAVTRAALDAGITLLDTADMYGHGKAEEALGDLFAESPGLRDRIVLQTKCGDRDDYPDASIDNSGAHIRASVEGSLRRLRTDRIDVLLLHWPDTLVQPDEVAEAFDDLHAAGKVRYFGVSNHSPYQIELLTRTVRQPIVINQIHVGLFHWTASAPAGKARVTHGFEGAATVDYCRLNGIQVQAYSALRGEGFQLFPFEPDADSPEPVHVLAGHLREIADREGVTSAAVALAWLLHHPMGIVPIIGANRPARVLENARAAQVRLSRQEWYRLLGSAAPVQSLTW